MASIEVVSVRHPQHQYGATAYSFVHRMQFQLYAERWVVRWAWRDGDLVAKTVWDENGQCIKDEYTIKPWDPRVPATSTT